MEASQSHQYENFFEFLKVPTYQVIIRIAGSYTVQSHSLVDNDIYKTMFTYMIAGYISLNQLSLLAILCRFLQYGLGNEFWMHYIVEVKEFKYH